METWLKQFLLDVYKDDKFVDLLDASIVKYIINIIDPIALGIIKLKYNKYSYREISLTYNISTTRVLSIISKVTFRLRNNIKK